MIQKGEIWLVEIPSTNGHEQSGKRPAIVLADTEANIVIIIPLSSNLQALRFPHTLEIRPSSKNGLKLVSVALVFHIRSIDKKRLINKIGEFNDISKLDSMLQKLLKG